MYGQLKSFKKGDADPTFMLTWENAIFIPTRFADIESYAIDADQDDNRDNVHLHLRVQGFLDPQVKEIEHLVKSLEQARQLPFGRDSGYKWVSICPKDVPLEDRYPGTDKFWSTVTDRFASEPSQFSGDIFWRVEDVDVENFDGRDGELTLEPRSSNIKNSRDRWHYDYRMSDPSEYVVRLRNRIPLAEEREIPEGATIEVRAKEDASSLIKIPETSFPIRRNDVVRIKMGTDTIDFFGPKYAIINLETRTKDKDGAYPPGSLVDLTVKFQKQRLRLICALIFAVAAVILIAAGGGMVRNQATVGIILIGTGVFCSLLSYWLWTDKIKISK